MSRIPGSKAEMYLISVQYDLLQQVRTHRMPSGQIRTKTIAIQLVDRHYSTWIEYVQTQPFDDE